MYQMSGSESVISSENGGDHETRTEPVGNTDDSVTLRSPAGASRPMYKPHIIYISAQFVIFHLES